MKVIVFIPQVEQNGHLIEDATIVNEKVPVFVNFDRSLPPIGTAHLTKDEYGVICAEFNVSEVIKGLYPAIGGIYENESTIKITEIGVCGNPNTDNRIEPIS